MNKNLIINADDFGFDPEASNGILELLSEHKISSTTVMANLVGNRELLELSKIKGIGIGLHLNLISGSPVSNIKTVSSLVSKDGVFFDAKALIKKSLTNQINFDHLFTEIKAQLYTLEASGIKITHVDSHQHSHQFPVLGKSVQLVLEKLGIKKLRNSSPLAADFGLRPILLNLFSQTSSLSNTKFSYPEGLISNFSFGSEINLENFNHALKKSFLNRQMLEFMTHPALEDRPDSYLKRKEEYLFWKTHPIKEILKLQNIELIHFGQMYL